MKLTASDVAYLYPTQVKAYQASDVADETVWCETRVTGKVYRRETTHIQRITISLYDERDWALLDELNKVWMLTPEQVESLRKGTGNERFVDNVLHVSVKTMTEESVVATYGQTTGIQRRVFEQRVVGNKTTVVDRTWNIPEVTPASPVETPERVSGIKEGDSPTVEEEPFLDTTALSFHLCGNKFTQKLLTHQIHQASHVDQQEGGPSHREKFTQRAGGINPCCPQHSPTPSTIGDRDVNVQRRSRDRASHSLKGTHRSPHRVPEVQGHAHAAPRSAGASGQGEASADRCPEEVKDHRSWRAKTQSLPQVTTRLMSVRVGSTTLPVR